MKNLKSKLIAMTLVLVLAVTVTLALPQLAPVKAKAATGEQFLSEVALIYKDTVEEAQAVIQGTDWKLFNKDLNPNADISIFDDGVYLAYKTSTNVEDAITDLRVMDMYGGYQTTNYQKEVEKSRKEYDAKIDQLRVATSEFKAKYEANDGMAKLAYRQMNYYKDVQTQGGTETGMKMGDFFLNLPTENSQIIQVLFEGNAVIVANLISLLAVGISGADEGTLSTRIAEKYAVKDSLADEEYYESAKELATAFATVKTKLLRYDTLKEQYDLEDEEMSEEEYVFLTNYATIADMTTTIQYGNQTLAEFIKGTWGAKDLYPIVAAFTPGQKALAEMGQLETLLKYNSPSKPINELTQALGKIEEGLKDEEDKIKEFDVYMGVDREIFKGDFAMTNAAMRQQALTGKTWGIGDAASRPLGMMIGYIAASVVDVALAGTAVGLAVKSGALKAATAPIMVESVKAITVSGGMAFQPTVVAVPNRVAEQAYASFTSKWGATQSVLGGVAIALTLIIAGSYGLSTWYNYYHPEYLEIPNTLIDVKETDAGDKYVKYSVAKVLNPDDGEENADFNAYQGKEWNALYYTKDANAGNCLTPNFAYKENNNAVSKRHQGVSMFGESNAYNLNSHVYRGNAVGVYLSVRYSNTKKAAADMPTVVGSMIGGVGYALSGIAGVGVGVGGMILFTRFKKKKEETQEVTTDGE